jgi:hypothetical protein
MESQGPLDTARIGDWGVLGKFYLQLAWVKCWFIKTILGGVHFMSEKISTRLIGLLSEILPKHYSHTEIDSIFLYCGAPEFVSDLSKPKKVQAWLRKINSESNEPLIVLGGVLDEFFSLPIVPIKHLNFWETDEKIPTELEKDHSKIRALLATCSLRMDGSKLVNLSETAPTIGLVERVRLRGLGEVEVEIDRALKVVEADPAAACHYAVNALEATLKVYIERKIPGYSGSDHLNDLAKTVFDNIGLRPKELDNKDLKQIASGMFSIVNGLMHLRNKKSGAHGRSSEHSKTYEIKPRHARLAINSAHSLATYILELI